MARTLDTYVWIDVRWIYPDSSVPGQYILVAAQKEKATELQGKLDSFKDRFMVEFTIDMRVEQGRSLHLILIFQLVWFIVSAAIADNVKSVHAGVENLQGGLLVIPVWLK